MKKRKSFKFKSYLAGYFFVFITCILLGNLGLNCIIHNDLNSNIEVEPWIMPKMASQYSAEWLTDGDFSSISNWYNTTGGDTSDVNGTYSDEQANFVMLGDNGNFTAFSQEIYPNQTGTWWAENNSHSYPVSPAVPRTPAYGIDSQGWWCSHEFKEGGQAWTTDNNPAVEFKRNYSLNVDLSDYSITSVYINATVNGTVYATDQSQNGGIEVPGDNIPDHAANYDWARFYIKAENIERTHVYELAYFNTLDVLLGRDTHQDGDGLDYLNNTFLTAQHEEILIAYLSAIFLNTDYGTFTIALGIEVYCEDNVSTEMDKWVELRFVNFDFNFTYEKKMTRYAQVSWNQIGNQLNGSVYQIDEARLNFKFKSNQVWPTTLSPNSEIRAYINNRRHSEVIKLADVNASWKEAKAGGFDVTSIVSTDENITLTIQVIIMDNFNLNSTYTLSIDNASLMIYYSHKTGTETQTKRDIFLNNENETSSRSIEIKFGEIVNVTYIYKDIFNAFIDDATVRITIGAEIIALNETSTHYYIMINTTSLNLGENFLTITATKTMYQSKEDEIKIDVLPLDTRIELFLDEINKTIEKSVDVVYDQDVNITIRYRNTENGSNIHVNNATVELTGTGTTLNLTENYAEEYYNVTINSEILGLGITYLTVNAQKENYSTQAIVFKVEVSTRGAYIDRVFINNTQSQTFEAPWKYMFNLTISYNDTETDDYITNATVQIEGTGYSETLIEDIGNQLYRVTINSSHLQIGINYLSITAQKENYSIATKLITITVTERETEMDIYLNQTLETVIEISWNEELNITAVYKDSGTFLSGASVSLREGSTILYNFSEHPDIDIYNLTINTAIFDIGVNALTVYAKMDNYSYSLESIMIIVFERDSDLITYLNQTPSTSIEIAYGELLNISAIYRDKDSETFVNGSIVSLKDSSTILYNFTKHPTLDIYNLTINTSDFVIGVKVLTIYAKADNYTASLESIIINVIERETELETYLNNTLAVSIDIAYDKFLNITALYNDLTNGFINGANLTLREGSTILYNFAKHPTLSIYNLTVNTADFGIGVRAFTIYAKKENYTLSLESIIINVVERETELETYLNNTLAVSIDIPYNEILNITAVFNDLITGFINGANLTLREGSTILYSFVKHPTRNIYNLTINTANIGIGVSAFTVYAEKENYTLSLESIIINVEERDTELDMYLNNTLAVSIDITYGELLNLTAIYNDKFTSTFLDGADVSLKEGTKILYNFTKHSSLDLYNLTINVGDLGFGASDLTVYATLDNHSAALTNILIHVIERDTEIEVYINQTLSVSIDITYGDLLNLTAIYTDKLAPAFLYGADVSLKEGNTILYNFTKHPSLDQYNLTFNVGDLGYGASALTVYAKLENYTAALTKILIHVIERDTEMEVYLNQTSSVSIDITHGELLNLTAIYKDKLTPTFLDGADVSLKEGNTILYNFTKHPSLDQYNLTINVAELSLGVNALTIYAKRDNYTAALTNIIINVIERESELTLYLNGNLENSIEITHGEILNITALFYDEEIPTTFLVGADVSLKEGNTILYNFTKHPSFDRYNLTINVADLGLGVSALTVYGNKDNYTASLLNIIINVIERESELSIYLNGSLENSIEIAHGELLNITALFYDKNISSTFLDGADVSLNDGTTTLYNFTKHPSFDQYNLTINVADLGLGVNSLTVYANLKNYTASLTNIIINVIERESELTIYLDNNIDTSIDIAHGEMLNITALFYDENIPTTFLNGADVSLKEGNTILYNFSKHPSRNQYNLTINVADLGLGVSELTIYAKLDNYTASLTNIIINVIERESELSIYLNNNLATSIEIDHGELLNLTALFFDKNIPTTFLDGANVSLKEGATILYNFMKHPTLDYYNLTINSTSLSLGYNLLTIHAKRNNFSASLETISITVNERDTYLNIILNNEDKTDDKSITLISGELLNISVYYKDFLLNTSISSATMQLLGQNMTELFNQTFNYYNYTLDSELLDIGVSFLSISAHRNNYTQISELITVIVREKAATYDLFLNNENKTIDKSISLIVNQTLNITLLYWDNLYKTHLTGANISLSRGLITHYLNENISREFYSIIINTSDLEQGVNFLNIFAQKDKYESIAVLFTISMIERETSLALQYNGSDITLTPSFKIPVKEKINFTLIYNDNITGGFIYEASVRIFGETKDYNFTEHAGYYSVIIDTEELNRGVNFLTIYAHKNNYEPHTIIVTIEVIDEPTNLVIFLNQFNKTQEKAIDLPIGTELNVTIKYLELNSSSLIEDATIIILGEGLSENLTFYQTLGYYSFSINTSELDIGIKLLTIIAEKKNYQTMSTTLRISVERINTNITTTSGEPNIEVEVGVKPKLEIVLSDIDFNTTVTEATVQYSWIYGTGFLEDTDGDGVYDVYLDNAPPGTYTVTVTAYAGDDYAFERYQVTVTVNKPPATNPEDFTALLVIFLVTLFSLIAVGSYAVLYQKKLKIPKPIRKLRRYRKTLKRVKGVENIEIIGRKDAIDEIYEGFIDKVSKNLKEKETAIEPTSLLTSEIASQNKK